MKTIFASLIISLLALPAMAETQHITVKGMTCAACAQSVEALLREEKMVRDVRVDVKIGQVIVTTQEGTTLSEAHAKGIIAKAGFEATKITTP
jgi:copper chaperone CopZ